MDSLRKELKSLDCAILWAHVAQIIVVAVFIFVLGSLI